MNECNMNPDIADTPEEYKLMVDTANQIVQTAITFLGGPQEWRETDPAMAKVQILAMHKALISDLAKAAGLWVQFIDVTGLHPGVDYLIAFTKHGLSGEATVPVKLTLQE